MPQYPIHIRSPPPAISNAACSSTTYPEHPLTHPRSLLRSQIASLPIRPNSHICTLTPMLTPAHVQKEFRSVFDSLDTPLCPLLRSPSPRLRRAGMVCFACQRGGESLEARQKQIRSRCSGGSKLIGFGGLRPTHRYYLVGLACCTSLKDKWASPE